MKRQGALSDKKNMSNRQDYLKKMELKKQAKLKAGLLSDRFPKISGIVIQMTYFRKSENPILMERTVNVFPTSNAYFNMDCMINECDNGGFDLTAIIAKQVKDHRKLVKGKMVCKGKISDLTSDHASISYEINIKYKKRSN